MTNLIVVIGQASILARSGRLSAWRQRWMRVDNTIAEVVRSTPSRPPMRSISASSSPIDAAATMAIRSNGPLTECSTRTSAILRSAVSIAPLRFGASVIST